MNRHGYYQVLHFTKPVELAYYTAQDQGRARQLYQYESFRTMFELLTQATTAKIICNRAHLGEYVYAPRYRSYSGDDVFDLERNFNVQAADDIRLILLTENFEQSRHFVDDRLSLGGSADRRAEQQEFLEAFDRSMIRDKRKLCITDHTTGAFRPKEEILNEALV